MTTLSVLCVTRGEDHAWPFLRAMRALAMTLRAEWVVVADGAKAASAFIGRSDVRPSCLVLTKSSGYIESVLDQGVSACSGDYVLRMDDDERCSPAMTSWLASGAWTNQPSWAFATAGLWENGQTVLMTRELWPQYHTRLSRRALAGGRRGLHAPSPHGRGALAPCVLEHHKFLVKSREARQAICARYESLAAGGGKLAHSVPEQVYTTAAVADLGEGWVEAIDMAPRRVIPMREAA